MLLTVPSITPAEALSAAAALAETAKRRFLEGAATEAADLADHAAKLVSSLDAEACAALKKLSSNFRAYVAGKAPAATPATPAAPPATVPPPPAE